MTFEIVSTVRGESVPEFAEFPSIARLSREVVVTEKIDGTNAQVHITDDGRMFAGSRTRWISPENDNHGFARWVQSHRDELMALGPGSHFGEWWGSGIQRGYGLPNGEKRFSLFNVGRWVPVDHPAGEKQQQVPACCHVVPILYAGLFDSLVIDGLLLTMAEQGSRAAPGFMKPEGIVVYHEKARVLFKKTLDGDGHKGASGPSTPQTT